MKIFILEDDPLRQAKFWASGVGHDITLAKDVAEAKEKFVPPYDVLLLDHDLGGAAFVDSAEENTGAGFCRWLRKMDWIERCPVVIHSYNPTGAVEMQRTLSEAGWEVVRLPFGATLLGWLEQAAKKKADSTA